MLDANEFGDAVAMLYEAAAVPEVWPTAIARLAEIAGCTGGLLFVHSGQGTNWVASKEFSPVFQRFLDQGWMDRNARMAGLLAHGGTGFVTDHDLFTEDELAETALYRDFLRPEGYGWGTATHVRSSSGETIVFTLERKFELGPVSRRDTELLDSVRPHLARAAVLASKLQMQRAQVSLDSFEKAGSPAALVGAGGALSAANPGFEALIGQISSGQGTRSRSRIPVRTRCCKRRLPISGMTGLAIPARSRCPARATAPPSSSMCCRSAAWRGISSRAPRPCSSSRRRPEACGSKPPCFVSSMI
ncbi:DNA-binding HTH domain-containing proteins [Bosea sp. BIWAKO-01]|nr:DNA-binding HTH domain-containing proteins [Bosea sp. BIWAKO-01]